MGHDTHFLERLSRASLSQTERALSLYRDPELVKALLGEIALPEGTERLAIALDDVPEPPHALVTRDGHFVTCLGPGMAVGDLPRVSFAKLQGVRARHARLREALDLSGSGRLRAANARLAENPMLFGRADAELLAAAHPLLGDALAKMSLDSLDTYLRLASSLVVPGGSTPRTERLRALWNMQWFLGHLLVAAVAQGPTALMRAQTAGPLADAWAAMGAHCALLRPTGLRLLWAFSRLGGRAIPALKVERATLGGPTGLRVVCLALATIGLRQAKHRAEVTKALQSVPPNTRLAPGDAARMHSFLVQYCAPLLAQLADPEKARVDAVAALARLCPRETPGLEHGAGAVVASTYSVDKEVDLPRWPEGVMPLLSWVAGASVAELYVPAGTYDCEPPRASMEFLVRLSRRSLGLYGKPLRAEPTAGRNDPCGCGSGKKFKRCCAA